MNHACQNLLVEEFRKSWKVKKEGKNGIMIRGSKQALNRFAKWMCENAWLMEGILAYWIGNSLLELNTRIEPSPWQQVVRTSKITLDIKYL